MDSLLQDLRDAARGLRRFPGFTGVAVLTLALGIGAASVMISVIYHVLFNALPYRDVDRVLVFSMRASTSAGGWKERSLFSAEELAAFRGGTHALEDMIGWHDASLLYDDGTSTRVFRGARVTPNTFAFLGVPPLIGRAVTPADADPGAPPVFVMNHRLWQREFGADPALLGKAFSLNGETRILVSVMPPRFDAWRADVWLPTRPEDAGGLTLMGRLTRGVSLDTASAELDAVAHRVAAAQPQPHSSSTSPEQLTVVARPLLDSLVGSFKKTLYILLASVALLLLIACSNVANLLLTRATVREREMAIRASLGATRRRLIRQLFVESLLLAALAAVAGWALGFVGLKLVVALIPPGIIPQETEIRLNGPVLLISLVVTVATAVLCSLAPALHVTVGNLQARLSGSGKGAIGSGRHGRMCAGLIVTEVALSMVLLIGAGLLIRSFIVLTQVDLGFDSTHVLYVRPWFPKGEFSSKEKQNLFTQELLERMKALPQVVSVAESMLVPPLTYDWSDTIVSGKPHAERWETRLELCSEGFFETLGVPLLHGRLFSDADVRAARRVAVVNQSFARQYFPNEEVLGKTVKFQVLDRSFLDAPHDAYFEIIGVVRDYKTRANEWETAPQAFLPYSVQGFSYRTFLARTTVDPETVLKSVEREIWAIDPHIGIRDAGSIAGSLRDYYRAPRFKLVTLGTFAAVSLVLVVMGVFSVMSYSISLRSQELGIRVAIGADRFDILRMVLFNGLRLVIAGVAIGFMASYTLTRVLASEISDVSVTDPWTFAIVITTIVAAGLAACLLPARRAMNVDPMIALRSE
jgi:putative ABC transport system permease protein